jgi:ribose/xylose/arabinose/galactoside ABC-type transport system permease subunit
VTSYLEKAKSFLLANTVLMGLVTVFLIGAVVSPIFLTGENLSNYARSTSIMGFVAIGMTFVILCGSIDLSVSSVFSLSGFLFIYLSKQSGILAIAVPLLVGLAVGLFNGVLITKLSIPAFVGTLATMLFIRGLVLVLTNEVTYKVGTLSPFLYYLGRGTWFGYIPVPLLMFSLAVLVASFVLNRRSIGRAMYTVGGNAEAAKMMGVSVTGTVLGAHMLSGLLASLGGILLASRVGAAYPLSGTGYELYAIAAVVIGGASLSGGIGKMSGTVYGTLIMGAFSNVFNLQKILDPVWELVVVGSVLLTVVFLQSLVRTYGAKRQVKERAIVANRGG